MTPTLAHAGHWLAEVLYLGPVIVIVGWISVKAVLDRRREGAERDEAVGAPSPSPAPDA